jgi:hypothetical protein
MHATSYEFWEGGSTPFVFRMVSTADYLTPMPGLSPLPTVTISKNGAAFGATDAVVTEIGNGWYKAVNPGAGTFLYTSAEDDGPYILHATAAGAVGSGVYLKAELWTGRSIARQVWGAVMGDHINDDSIGVAVYNALRGYQHTAGPGGSSAGVPEGTVGLRLASDAWEDIEVEPGVNPRQALSAMAAVLVGKSSGLGTTNATFYAMGASGSSGTSTTRVVAAVDSEGNRSTVMPTLPA